MDIVNELTDSHVAYWGSLAEKVPIKGRHIKNTDDCNAVVTVNEYDQGEIHVAWKPDDIDLAALAQGGTLWVTFVGGIPPHRVEVQFPT